MLWQNYVARPKLNMFKKYYARQVTCIKLRLLDFLLPSKKREKNDKRMPQNQSTTKKAVGPENGDGLWPKGRGFFGSGAASCGSHTHKSTHGYKSNTPAAIAEPGNLLHVRRTLMATYIFRSAFH